MTLLKQTTSGGADDNFSKLDTSDIEVDCSAHSLNNDSLLHGMQSLTLSHDTLRATDEETSEIFASLDTTKSGGSGQDSGVISGTQYRGDDCLGSEATDAESDDSKCRGCIADRGQVCWEEMCEAYPDQDGDT